MMESIGEVREKILAELKSEDSEVRSQFLGKFEAELAEFTTKMAEAFIEWREFDNAVNRDQSKALVSVLVYSAITLHVLSLKLFISGHAVAAGALERQVVESIALSLLCSRKDLGVLDRFSNDRYSTKDAVTHVVRKAKQLGLKTSGVAALQSAQHFYHKYSHISKLTIAAGMSFAGQGLYVGASFDEGKMDAYVKEVSGRVSLARVFVNFVVGVRQNVGRWQ